jgi:Trypsin-co-occurring domain 1
VARRDWWNGTGDYDDPGSPLSRRLELVQGQFRNSSVGLEKVPDGPHVRTLLLVGRHGPYAGDTHEGTVPVASQVVKYQMDDSTVVGFEIEPGPGFQSAGAKEFVGQVRKAVEPTVEAAKAVLDRVKEIKPDGVEVKFGVKVTGEANWVVAKAATEGNFEITLSWESASVGSAASAAP